VAAVELVLALDAGTTGVRTVAYDRSATVVDSAYRELTQYFPAPGEVEHDPVEIGRLAVETLTEVARRRLASGAEIVALGITNQRETTIAFDRHNGHSAHRALVWQDRRASAHCGELIELGYERRVRELTGLVLDPYFSGTKMRWLLDHGVLERATLPALATVDAYLLWMLTGGPEGGELATEPSNASRTMLLDITTRQWSSELAGLLGVPLELLPQVRASNSHFGSVAAEAVPELAGVPITGILGDQQAALFGQACFVEGMVKATYGTGAFILANAGTSVPVTPDGLVATIAWDLGEGAATYALEGSAFVAGAAIQWLRDELGVIERSDQLGPLASTVADTGGVSFVPAFTGLGSPFWRPDARGAIVGLTRGSSRAHLARAVLEAQAHQVRAMTDAFDRAGLTIRELRADGGAAAMDLLLDLQATATRTSVRRSASLEATARGAATLAGLSVGLWESLDELSAMWSSTYDATPDDPTLVDASYASWRAALERA
jgi:glycerol kinase